VHNKTQKSIILLDLFVIDKIPNRQIPNLILPSKVLPLLSYVSVFAFLLLPFLIRLLPRLL
jgi:hypothetical protein